VKLLSISIPSYNRPDEIITLLESIDESCSENIEIIICEDKSPKRELIKKRVLDYAAKSKMEIKYFENPKNYGFDKNLQTLITHATGEFIMYMGDDDVFEKENLKAYINFLKENRDLGYILRRYKIIHEDGSEEDFKYYNSNLFLNKGVEGYYKFFRKSTFISGFCFKRDIAEKYLTSDLDGTLLFQLYLLAEICMDYPSAYCDIGISIMDENKRGIPEFGSSENEGLYTPGKVTVENSVNFMKSYLVVTKYIDSIHKIDSTSYFVKEISKYSYPILAIQRIRGIKEFRHYCNMLKQEIGINSSIYFYIYYYSLIILGEKNCRNSIILIKKLLGKTPEL
jgi:abequosyltransferase